ncbi:MAG: HAD family hydrolase [Spirochaetaceae bacterium]|nr:MAG: HAD family hydrolase [Spirochaetaceae bacterium]
MIAKGLVFLDFDGVICDSLLETLVSSWQAYHLLRGKQEPTSMPVTLRRDFASLRPYVRAGEDFVVIQELISARTPIRSQEEFDLKLAERKAEMIDRYRETFYGARQKFLENNRSDWMSLNRLYPHVYICLIDWASSPSLYILSTKRANFIVEILAAKGIDMDSHRVLSCGAKEKKGTILSTLDERGREQALFIDDQIDHLASDWSRHPRISGCLASWGYVQQQWLEDPRGIEVLHPHEFANRVGPWLQD